jgi:hypothetical protein
MATPNQVVRRAYLFAAGQGLVQAGQATGDWWRSLDPTTQARLVQGSSTLAAQILARRQAGQQISPQEAAYLAPAPPPVPMPPAQSTPDWLPVAIVGGIGLVAVILLTARQ